MHNFKDIILIIKTVDKNKKIQDNIQENKKDGRKENEKNKKNDKKPNNIYFTNNIDLLYNPKRSKHNRNI